MKTATSFRVFSPLILIPVIFFILSLCLISCDSAGDSVRSTISGPPEEPQPQGLKPDHIDAPVTARLCWTCNNNYLKYDVYFGIDTNPPQVAANINRSYYNLNRLEHSQTYYWRIVAKDNHGRETSGPVWKFTTIEEDGVIHFPDPEFEQYIRERIYKPVGEIRTSDVQSFVFFTIPNVGNIEGIEHFENIYYIMLSNTKPEDISLIGLLPKIGAINANNFNQNLLRPIKNLNGAKSIYFRYIRFDNLSYLPFYDSLKILNFYWCPINDTYPLGKLKNLAELEVRKTWLTDITFAKDLSNLETLDISENYITDIEPLSNIENLTRLNISLNVIEDISPIVSSSNLRLLSAANNKISDISSLQFLVNLQSINLKNNKINDIKPLVNNPGIGAGDQIDLTNNPLSEISIRSYIPELQQRRVYVSY